MDGGISRRTLLAQLGCAGLALAQTTDPLRTLRSAHPRLVLLNDDVERLQTLIRDNAQARRIYNDLVKEADKIQALPPVEERPAVPRALTQGRRVLDRVCTLALLYRLDHKNAYLERTVKELRAAANFRDWNPTRFLDVAEMTHAFALAYDWLHPALSPEERGWIANAIVQKGLVPGLQLYASQAGFVSNHFYWNMLCNTGMTMGALAVADDEPDRAAAVLRYGIESIPRGIGSYGTDGGWIEGPEYWGSATRSTAVFLAALDSALGLDFGISNQPGLSKAGRFRVYFSGPSNKTFNYSDSGDDLTVEPAMFWLARRYAHPVFSWQEQRLIERSGSTEPLDLVWYQRDAKPPQAPQWPLDAVFQSVQCAFFRSAWEDPNGLFLAVKGGDNKAPHAHLDLGSFVFDAGGVRWALDLGPEDADPRAYNGRLRWTFYRTRTEAHNTLLVENENQDPRAEARITRHDFAPDLAWAQIDLSKAYPTRVKQMQRRIGLAQRQAILIQDTMQADQPVDVQWGMMTDADIALHAQTAELTKEGWTLSCEIRTPRHAVFDMVAGKGSRKLVVRIGEKVTDLDLNIVMTPHKSGTPKPKITAQFPV